VLAIGMAAVAIIAFAILVITGLLAAWALWAFIAWRVFGGCGTRRRHRALRQGGQWQVHRVSHQAEREAWL
jgi:hypothetical protein